MRPDRSRLKGKGRRFPALVAFSRAIVTNDLLMSSTVTARPEPEVRECARDDRSGLHIRGPRAGLGLHGGWRPADQRRPRGRRQGVG